MKRSPKKSEKPLTGEQQLKIRIDAADAKERTLFRSLRTAMRKRFPTANELVYDYTRSLVISYSPNERGSDAAVAIVLGPNGVCLYFNQGPELPDPKKILLGSGRQTRYIVIESAKTLKLPEVESLLTAAAGAMKIPLPVSGRGAVVFKPSSSKQQKQKKG